MAEVFTGTTIPLQSFIFYKSFFVPTSAACIRSSAPRVRTDQSQRPRSRGTTTTASLRYVRMEKASRLISDAGAKSGPA